ncbi:hypothetical protein B0H21DRAFT_758294 [Amylocystis lapponica]|nr:hypothetical protein B0H21DRAFT_758294 [Amylocystis lapponica]
MVEQRKRTGSRKPAKPKKSGQRSLLDIFSVRTSSLKSTDSDATSDPPGPSQSTRDTAPSTPEGGFTEIPRDSSSPPVLSVSSDREEATAPRVNHRSTFEGASRDAPIVIDATPVKPANSNKPLFSIFASRAKPPANSDVSRPSKPKPNKGTTNSIAPYPDHYSQHVRGDQSNFVASGSSLARRTNGTPAAVSSLVSSVDSEADHSSNSGPPCPDLPLASTSAPSIIEPFIKPDITQDVQEFTVQVPFDMIAREQYLSSIPPSHRDHPAIANLLNHAESSNWDDTLPHPPSQELWTDKWRPRRAEQVIGNEEHALYLRAWLVALKLHVEDSTSLAREPAGKDGKEKQKRNKKNKGRATAKGEPRSGKRRIVRRAQKPRKRRKYGDKWDPTLPDEDDSEEELAPYESDDDFFGEPPSRLRRGFAADSSPGPVEPLEKYDSEDKALPPLTHRPPQFGDEIYNSIMLVGPSGCGKTASVYACAEELGWDVFEVYPGIGERSGAVLNRLIGEVGKNHLVRQTQRQQKEPLSWDTAQAKGRGRANGRRPQRIDSDDELDIETKVEHPPLKAKPTAVPVPDTPSVGQSIVLVEEVDVLFERDTNFWPALINILKDCRRPVVMTCNDVSLIPVNDLPLQNILTFSPCPASLATSYLQSLCALERFPLERALISGLYMRPDGSSSPPPSHISIVAPTSSADLRRTINRLQFGLTHQSGDSGTPIPPENSKTPFNGWRNSVPDLPGIRAEDKENLATLHSLSKHRNILSFADCHLDRRPLNQLQDDMTALAPAADSEQGYTHLRDAPAPERTPHWNSAFYDRDQVIADELARSSTRAAAGLCPAPTAVDAHARAAGARACAARIDGAFRGLGVPLDVLVDRAAVALEYAPWVRHMVAVDDALEAAAASAPNLTSRTTVNSRSEKYARWISLEEEHRRTLRDAALALTL